MFRPGPDINPRHFHKLAGTVKDGADQPLKRKVRALDIYSSRPYFAWSDPTTGQWELSNIPARVYVTLVHDHTKEFQAQVFDYVPAVPME